MTFRLAAGAALLVTALAACGTTVPLSDRGAAPGDGLLQPTQGTADPQGSAPTTTATGGTTGDAGGTTGTGAPGSTATGSGGSTTGTSGGSSGPVAAPGALPTKGFGWDAKAVYVGVPTADDFNKAAAAAGANFDNGDVHATFDAIVADINVKGGVLGRKLVLVYHDAATAEYSSNPTGVAQSMCSYFTSDRPVVAVINSSPQLDSQPNFHTCLERKQVSLLSLTNTVYSDKDYQRLGPHLYSIASLSTDVLVPTFVSALARQGFFTGWDTTLGAPGKAPVKVGLLLPDDPAGRYAGSLFKAQLRKAGQQAPTEFYYPPAGGGTQSQSEVLAFKSAGVTHVLKLPPVELEVALFQRTAENQHYRPRYGYTVFDLPLTVEENPAVAPPAQQRGSLGIGWQPLNDVNASKDVGNMPGGARCFAALKARGIQHSEAQRRAKFGASLVCDALYLLRDAMVKAGGLTGDDLLRAMPRVGPRFTPASTFGASMANHGMPTAYRDSAYDSVCSCFAYRDAVNRPFSR